MNLLHPIFQERKCSCSQSIYYFNLLSLSPSLVDAWANIIGTIICLLLALGLTHSEWRICYALQMVGQVIWCVAHTVWIGNSVAVAASIGLIAHHLFGVWNGDRRLAIRHGKDFEIVKRRTSIVPFAAILDGRQKFPKDFFLQRVYSIAVLHSHCHNIRSLLCTSVYAGS